MEYVIKKKLVGGEQLLYRCQSCAGNLESPLTDAGKQDTCPLCGHTFTVPGQEELKARRDREVQKRDRSQMEARLRASEAEARRVEAIRAKAEQRLAQNMAGQAEAYEGKLTFEGRYAPQVTLLDQESVLDTFQTGFWDFAGHKRLVLTTHRLFSSTGTQLDVLWLPRVTSVTIRYALNIIMVIAAVLLLISVIPVVYNTSAGQRPLLLLIVPLMLGLAGLLVIFARRKTMLVSTGDDKISINLTRLKPEESSRFVNNVFATLPFDRMQ
jgi:uncharacterized Zn finger protein (UPF0148 family)